MEIMCKWKKAKKGDKMETQAEGMKEVKEAGRQRSDRRKAGMSEETETTGKIKADVQRKREGEKEG